MSEIKVTVYITSHNYGRFLAEAVESVVSQSLNSWELIIVDDGSGDETFSIAAQFAAEDSRIQVIRHRTAMGLRACANKVLELARGQYFIRLDADDYFDESALLVLSKYLDKNKDIGLVFPNWMFVDEDGNFLGVENRKKLGIETDTLDLPAHGACTMVRKRVMKSVGGYETEHDSQDGHELWLKVIHRYGVANVSTPLFFYRQHGQSMSRDENRLLNARQRIKHSIASKQRGAVNPRVVAVIPAKNTYDRLPNIALQPVLGKPLIDYTIEAAIESNVFEEILVFTDDPNVIRYCEKFPGVLSELRDPVFSGPRAKLAEILEAAVNRLETHHNIYPDIAACLSVHSPLREWQHIREAVETLKLYNVDNVVSTYEDIDLHFLHGANGMTPLNKGMLSKLRFEREALYVDNGAIHASWREHIGGKNLFHGRIGHIVMPREKSMQVKDMRDLQLVEYLITSNYEHTQKAMK